MPEVDQALKYSTDKSTCFSGITPGISEMMIMFLWDLSVKTGLGKHGDVRKALCG